MKTNKLVEIIGSMTMSEKRYFKIFSKRHVIGETNNYLLMFDFLDKYGEEGIKELVNQPFVKNVSAEKNYLFRLILKCLNTYYYDFSAKMKVQNSVLNSEVLAYKGLEELALKELEKAEKLAKAAELFAQVLVVKQTQFEILSSIEEHKKAAGIMDNIKKFEPDYVHFNRLQKLKAEVNFIRQQKGGFRSSDELQEFERLTTNRKEEVNDSSKLLLFSLSIEASTANSYKRYEEQKDILSEIKILYELNPYLIEQAPKQYLSTLYNYANTHRHLKNFKSSILILDELESKSNLKLISSSKKLLAFIFYLSNNLRLYIYLLNNEIDIAEQLADKIKNASSEYMEFIDKQVLYEHYMLLIRLSFTKKNYKEALRYTNIIINDTSFSVREDLVTYVRLLNLVVHFELENEFTLEYLSKSTLYYLKRKNKLYQTEKEVIKFINTYRSNKLEKLRVISENLFKLRQDENEKRMFDFFDFYIWSHEKTEQFK